VGDSFAVSQLAFPVLNELYEITEAAASRNRLTVKF